MALSARSPSAGQSTRQTVLLLGSSSITVHDRVAPRGFLTGGISGFRPCWAALLPRRYPIATS